MNKTFNKIFNESACLSEEMMLAYTENRLTPKEKHGVEKHLLHCELCTDAMEGLALIEKGKQHSIVERINTRIKERIKEKNVKVISINRRITWAAAATIAILTGLSVFFYRSFDREQKLKNMSENTVIDKKAERPASVPEKNVEFQKNADREPEYLKEADVQESGKIMDVDQTPASDPETSKEETQEIVSLAAAENKAAVSDEDIPSEAEEKAADAAMPAAGVTREEYYQVDQSSASEKKSAPAGSQSQMRTMAATESAPKYLSSILESALHMYESKNYRNAINLFKEVLSDEPENDKALFYCGMSYMNLGQFSESADYLSQVKKGEFYEDAQWRLANVYFKQGDRKKATKILKNLSEREGKYKEKATEMLNATE